MSHKDCLSTAQTWLSSFYAYHPDETEPRSGEGMIIEPSKGVETSRPKDPGLRIAGHKVVGGKPDKQVDLETKLGKIPKVMLNDSPKPFCGSLFGMVEVRSPKRRPAPRLPTVPETPEESMNAGMHSKLPRDQDSERYEVMPMDWGCRSRAPTVSVRELDHDISPTNTDPGHFCTMIESMAPEVEEILRRYANSSRKSSSSTPDIPEEAGNCGSPDRKIEFDAVVWSPEQHEDDPWQKTTHSDEKMTHEPSQSSQDKLVVVGGDVQILADSIGGAYGVPVTKASVEVARRDSGIRFTLTCVEDGYEDAEVLFDDDFLYEEEMMDPDYFQEGWLREAHFSASSDPSKYLLTVISPPYALLGSKVSVCEA
ncbi:hypothetical protein SLS55_004317 [Diplodia seriata]|uniref:Uncharacterized protein n=1 Tax=Diplodia seriata TaxID=420778 RepID=A0ABR3CJ11_9PEZI